MPNDRAKLREEALSWAKTLAGAFAVYCAVTTVAFANYSIPSESMAPTLEVGDRVVVSKYAYGYSRYSLPLNLGALFPHGMHRLFEHLPARGDVVVFIHPRDGRTIIKRLVGLPGDVIEVRGGRLSINGQELPSTTPTFLMRQHYPEGLEAAYEREETLPGAVQHVVHEFPSGSPLDNFGPYRVPDGAVFMMGDNRDNSLDSRASEMGPVPIENLIGRAETVYFAPRGCNADQSCRARWLKPMHD
ncbi:MAG TPA: signal peptidase I [Caulobacterales bacterium]|nr:signal peptidase I [Caulobacterales bacterium]